MKRLLLSALLIFNVNPAHAQKDERKSSWKCYIVGAAVVYGAYWVIKESYREPIVIVGIGRDGKVMPDQSRALKCVKKAVSCKYYHGHSFDFVAAVDKCIKEDAEFQQNIIVNAQVNF